VAATVRIRLDQPLQVSMRRSMVQAGARDLPAALIVIRQVREARDLEM
jgi:hypothetical protein